MKLEFVKIFEVLQQVNKQESAILVVMLCLLILTLLTSVLAGSPCRNELEAIVKTSQNCVEKYLKKISKELIYQSELLFTASANEVIASFEQKYQVLVQLTSPFATFNYSESCFRVEANELPLNITDSYQTVTYNTSNLPSLPITSVRIETVADQFDPNFRLDLYVYRPVPDFATTTIIFHECFEESSMNVTFDDSATLELQNDYCPGFSSGAAYKPYNPLSQVFQGQLMNQVYKGDFTGNYDFNGGVLRSFTIILCSKQNDPFTFDQSRAVINYPAFRYDYSSEKHYYTFVIRNEVGEMFYITIQKDASTMTCK